MDGVKWCKICEGVQTAPEGSSTRLILDPRPTFFFADTMRLPGLSYGAYPKYASSPKYIVTLFYVAISANAEWRAQPAAGSGGAGGGGVNCRTRRGAGSSRAIRSAAPSPFSHCLTTRE
ncbi:unnamed protein product [Colias eurytheme]|nr:unnamed protein product [Colias eurytheme]